MSETLVQAWGRGRDALKAAGVESPVLDARVLLERAAGVTRTAIVTDPHQHISPHAVAAFDALLARRLAREPVSHILGRKAFWTLEFAVSPAVLAPRPETEFLVEGAVAETASTSPLSVLDLGVGSGAILLSILSMRPLAMGLGVDVSADALAVARANAEALGMAGRTQFRLGDWDDGLEGQFDVIVSNPPYIPTNDIEALEPEVRDYEPRLALDGGADGLSCYRQIAPAIKRRLAPAGVALLEFGAGQADAVTAIVRAAGLNPVRLIQDLGARPRCLVMRQPEGG
jgi:release factor glutamine methyltransferase